MEAPRQSRILKRAHIMAEVGRVVKAVAMPRGPQRSLNLNNLRLWWTAICYSNNMEFSGQLQLKGTPQSAKEVTMYESERFRQDFSAMPQVSVQNKTQYMGGAPVRNIFMESEIRPRKNIGRCFMVSNSLKLVPPSGLLELRKRTGFTPRTCPGKNRLNSEWFETAKEYTQNTTLHGLRYVGDDELHIVERLFWTITFVSGILAAAYFITILYKRWDDNPMIISLSPTATLLNSIPFPAITICNMNGAKKSIAESIMDNEQNDSQALFEKQMLRELCGEGMNDTGYPMDMQNANWSKIQQFMIKVSQPCHEMMVSCKWRSESMSCNDLFNPELTDEGMCCSFNKVERGFIYRNPKQLQGLNYTFPYPGIDWTPEKGYPDNAPENANPWRAFGAGKSMGLSIVLDADLCDYYCSSTASVGFKLLLHNPIETPKISDFAYFLTPGLETRVEIMPRISSSTPSLFSIPQAKRQCVFSSDRELRFYRTYTQRNCELECQSNFTLSHCKCVPFYLPKDVSTRICGTKDNECVTKAREVMEHRLGEDKINSTEWQTGAENCSCLPSCVQIRYGKQMTTSKLEDIFTVKPDYLSGKQPAYYKKNMAVVHFFFLESTFTGFEKGEIFGFTDFLSNTGGLLGLFLGFSFMSAAEIFYFMSLRIFCLWHRKQKGKQNEATTMEYPFAR